VCNCLLCILLQVNEIKKIEDELIKVNEINIDWLMWDIIAQIVL